MLPHTGIWIEKEKEINKKKGKKIKKIEDHREALFAFLCPPERLRSKRQLLQQPSRDTPTERRTGARVIMRSPSLCSVLTRDVTFRGLVRFLSPLFRWL